MNEATRLRVDLARRNAARFAADPNVKAIMLVGSVAHGVADDFSDVDCTVFCERALSAATYDAICAEARQSGGDLYYGSPSEGFAVYQYVEGIRCDFGFETIASAERSFAEMLDQPDTDLVKQLVAGGVVSGFSLYGAEWLAPWQARLAHYPPGLGPAMVRQYLRFHPRWVLEKMGVERGDWLFLHEAFLEAERNILGILCGLNHLYHPGKLKGAAWTIDRMSHKPPDLLARFERILRDEPTQAVEQLIGLIYETLALIEAHLPEVDTSRNRRILQMVLRK
jgi:hypothetical protein